MCCQHKVDSPPGRTASWRTINPNGTTSKSYVSDFPEYFSFLHIYHLYDREALYNAYDPLSKDNWNQTLRKAGIFHSSWTRNKIRTTHGGYFDDQISGHHESWKKGVDISVQEIISLKMYVARLFTMFCGTESTQTLMCPQVH